MRPITNGEYKRMRTQTEARISGMSVVCFKIRAKTAGVVADEWVEDGFICNFTFAGQQRTESGFQLYAEKWVHDTVFATALFPMRYLTDKATVFQVKNPAAILAGWGGNTFDPINIPTVATIDGSTSLAPYVTGVTLKHYCGGITGNLADFNIIGQPDFYPDCFSLKMEGEFNVNVISQYDTFSTQGNAYLLLGSQVFTNQGYPGQTR